MSKIKVCEDAGHYGKYNQGVVKEYWESDMTWKLHNLLATELVKYGVSVVKTRDKQANDLGLEARGKLSTGCNLFLSLHSNANPSSKTTDYPLACCMVNDNSTRIDDISCELGLKLAQKVGKIMGCKQSARILQRVGTSGTEWYAVLRGAKKVGTPAILLECGFHTNVANATWLLNDSNLKLLASGLAEEIANYFGVTTSNAGTSSASQQTALAGLYKIKANSPDGWLCVRDNPSLKGKEVSRIENGNLQFTIMEEKTADGVIWGKLKSGLGWVSTNTNYVTKIDL